MPIRLATCAFVRFYTEHITFRHCQQHMPRQRHERRHSVVAYGTGVKPPKPGASRYDYPGITSPLPMRPVSDENASVRDRGGPGKGFPQPGRISA